MSGEGSDRTAIQVFCQCNSLARFHQYTSIDNFVPESILKLIENTELKEKFCWWLIHEGHRAEGLNSPFAIKYNYKSTESDCNESEIFTEIVNQTQLAWNQSEVTLFVPKWPITDNFAEILNEINRKSIYRNPLNVFRKCM